MGALRALNERNKAGEQEAFASREAEVGGGGGGLARKKIKIKMTGKDWGGGGSYDLGSYLPHLEL